MKLKLEGVCHLSYFSEIFPRMTVRNCLEALTVTFGLLLQAVKFSCGIDTMCH